MRKEIVLIVSGIPLWVALMKASKLEVPTRVQALLGFPLFHFFAFFIHLFYFFSFISFCKKFSATALSYLFQETITGRLICGQVFFFNVTDDNDTDHYDDDDDDNHDNKWQLQRMMITGQQISMLEELILIGKFINCLLMITQWWWS